MLLEATPDAAAAAGTALGSFLTGLASSGPIGALIAVALAGLCVIFGTRLVRELRSPAGPAAVTIDADAVGAAADRVGLAGRAADAECRQLVGRVEELEDWQREHVHQHQLAAAVEAAREEGAREAREHTNPGTRRR